MTHFTLKLTRDIDCDLKEKMDFTEIGMLIEYHKTSVANLVKNKRMPRTTNFVMSLT